VRAAFCKGNLASAEIAVGDVTDPDSLTSAAADVDAVIFVHGSDNESSPDALQRIDYGGESCGTVRGSDEFRCSLESFHLRLKATSGRRNLA